ncbi:KxYKxGKxW signal peptide domain-containing protein, partial [Pediococcus ethanolidurans]|uniref:KxYKxGKxW signal peptide domain-containing protein n=1 Tax=Pediococcus ethanolidurans TaxID=319653 RepID=UPI0021E94DEE
MFEQSKEHFKMYKVAKTWVFAGITVLFFSSSLYFVNPEVKADDGASINYGQLLVEYLYQDWR